MSDKLYLVIGDDYAAFATDGNVVTVSELTKEIANCHPWRGDEIIVFGQGISESARNELKLALESCNVSRIDEIDVLAPLHLTHKKDRDNILITRPRNIAPKRYQFDLALNDRLDRLSDHVTGQHVGAMLLMEAARQSVIATLECEYASRRGLILDHFNSQFFNYAFPVPTLLTVTLMEIGEKSENYISTVLTIEFQQAGKRICEMQLDVKLYEPALLEKVEARRARQTLDMLQNQLFKAPYIAPEPA